MFDAATAELIRSAPPLQGVDPAVLPQELTRVFAELVLMRMRTEQAVPDNELSQLIERLTCIASIYEVIVDTRVADDRRRAAAFVAATAHQVLAKTRAGAYSGDFPLLTATSIHPTLAAPLLFLIAEQNADAREAARPFQFYRDEKNVLKSAVVESIYDLATEQFENIVERADRLRQLRVSADFAPEIAIEQSLYGLCWSGVVGIACGMLERAVPELEFQQFDNPQAAFEAVVTLASREIDLEVPGGALISLYAGPRHLARLLRHVAGVLDGKSLVSVQLPGGEPSEFWKTWLRQRAVAKPVLWQNHRQAIATGFLQQGRSAVLVLPTGAGKTTLSELKIASTIAADKKVIFLVPTLSLVEQLRDDLGKAFPASAGQIGVAVDGDLTGLLPNPHLQAIEVMTPERCLALMSHAPDAVQDVGLIVFDECHLLSPHGGGKRSLDAMLCLVHALKKAPQADFLLLSAMLTNADQLAAWLEQRTGRPCTAFQDVWKPSRQARGLLFILQLKSNGYGRRERGRRARSLPRQPPRHSLFLDCIRIGFRKYPLTRA